MERFRVLIVDDEPLAREGLREKLLSDPEIEIVAECANGREAVSSIKDLSPNLIFLDVEMPVLDGFGVVETVGVDCMPLVIFVTAYDQFAVRAFESHALDYLLKPVNTERLRQSLKRAKQQLSLRKHSGVNQNLADLLQELRTNQSQHLERLAVRVKDRVIFLKADEIDYVESEDNYVRLHHKKEAHLLRETLTSLASKLDPSKFLRIRRSTLVNVERIKELRPLFNSECIVVLEDGTQLQTSRRYRKNLDSLLKP